MSWIADAHYEWHHANPERPWDCPLDCGWGEAANLEADQEVEEDHHHIICGNCKDLHETAQEVRDCYGNR